MDEDSFNAVPARTYWDNDVAIQHEAVAARRQAGDRLGEDRARNALGLLCLCRGYLGVALYREAGEVLAESLAVFRERGDASSGPRY